MSGRQVFYCSSVPVLLNQRQKYLLLTMYNCVFCGVIDVSWILFHLAAMAQVYEPALWSPFAILLQKIGVLRATSQ